PEQAQAEHLKRLAETGWQSARARQSASSAAGLERRVAGLEKDAGYVALVLGSLLETVDDKGVVTREEVRAEMAVLDDLDGVKDGRLDIRVLRGKTS
ncbi:MAG: hypothetical protein ACREIU_01510, partial [Planctomycetota bacterium]